MNSSDEQSRGTGVALCLKALQVLLKSIELRCSSMSKIKDSKTTSLTSLAKPAIIACVLTLTTAPLQSQASSLEYTPVNPSFGGNPLNGNMLLNNAQAQNDKKDPALSEELDALEDFNDRLQRALLTRLTRSVTSTIVDDLGNLIPGETVTSDFIINVVDEGDGTLSVTTTDRVTGDSTVFWVEASF